MADSHSGMVGSDKSVGGSHNRRNTILPEEFHRALAVESWVAPAQPLLDAPARQTAEQDDDDARERAEAIVVTKPHACAGLPRPDRSIRHAARRRDRRLRQANRAA